MMKGNINLISYDCYQQATEKQLAGLKWKENRVYYISEIHNEKIQDEIYGYIDDRCRRLSLSTVVNDIYRFDLLKEFLNEKCTSCSSITDKKWEELERSYKAFLYKKGLALYVRRNRPDRRNVEQQSSAQVSFLKMYYEYVVKCKTADIPENVKDIWDMRKLDIVPRSNPIRGRYRLDFREIRQKEFKEIIKKILYSHCQTKAMGSIKGELRGFRRFASFMYDRFPEVKHFTEISRDMIEDYLVYIKTDTGLTSVSYTTELSVLDNLLDEIGRELEIENICNLFLSSDCRAYDNALPEAYSDAEIRRFNSALTKLKPQLRYCFGYGLSYTSFEYSDMEVTLNETTDDCTVNIRVKIVNAGQKSGDEVVQLYICDDVSSYTTPAKQLRAFERIHLEAGESQIVTFTLNKKSMMLYMQDDEWVVEPGSFSLMIGSSSQDIRLQHKIYVTQKYCLK